jgi:arsenate reductase
MLYHEITDYLNTSHPSIMDQERQEKWRSLSRLLKNNGNKGAINFICTHNARRSVLSQALATAIAHQNGFAGLVFWSGGAEVTFVHPNTIAALQRIGFRLLSQSKGTNPTYELRFSEDALPLKLFSKTFDDASSPAPYHAVLVCSKGDAACPYIPEATSRTLIPFEDPGAFDGTLEETKAYDASAAVIAGELRYFFEQLMTDGSN